MNVAGEVSDTATDHKANIAVESNSAQQVLKTLDEEAAHACSSVPKEDSGSVEPVSTELSSEAKRADAGLAITSVDGVASRSRGELVSGETGQRAETSATEKDKLSGEKNLITHETELVEAGAKVPMDGCTGTEGADSGAENSGAAVPAKIISTDQAKSGLDLKMENSESKEATDFIKNVTITTIDKTSNAAKESEEDHRETLANGAADNAEAVSKCGEKGVEIGGGLSTEDSTTNEEVSSKIQEGADIEVANVATKKKISFFTKLNDIFDMKALNFKPQKSKKKKSVLETRKSGDNGDGCGDDDDAQNEENLGIADKDVIVEAVEKEKSEADSGAGGGSVSDAQSSRAIKPDNRRFSLRDMRDKVYGKTGREASSEAEEIPGFIGYIQSFMRKKDKKSIIDDNHSIVFGCDTESVIQSEVGEACKEAEKEHESQALNQEKLDAKKETEQNGGSEVKDEIEKNETMPVKEEAETKESLLTEEVKNSGDEGSVILVSNTADFADKCQQGEPEASNCEEDKAEIVALNAPEAGSESSVRVSEQEEVEVVKEDKTEKKGKGKGKRTGVKPVLFTFKRTAVKKSVVGETLSPVKKAKESVSFKKDSISSWGNSGSSRVIAGGYHGEPSTAFADADREGKDVVMKPGEAAEYSNMAKDLESFISKELGSYAEIDLRMDEKLVADSSVENSQASMAAEEAIAAVSGVPSEKKSRFSLYPLFSFGNKDKGGNQEEKREESKGVEGENGETNEKKEYNLNGLDFKFNGLDLKFK
ncbi:hypothetical protein AYI70_g2494 [Smittium culicis]|uniref:Uncharacterized protein n=2 Tax=Smittium culicis TaxID=133412 RepID=A0A1R1Y7Z1_9FUNG|nr:hypothetical protein AYI70_g2494 [Smittium culicis]